MSYGPRECIHIYNHMHMYIYIYIYIHIGNDILGYTSLKHADSYCSEDVPT